MGKTLKSVLAAFTLITSFLGASAGRDVRITYSEEDGIEQTKDFDLLVVACDPSSLSGVFDGRTDLEERVEKALRRFTLATSLWDVRRGPGDENTYTERVSPDRLSAADGGGGH